MPIDPRVALAHAPLLDHGFVRLVESMGNDLTISRAARVSYDADWRAGVDAGSDEKLIHYLWRNQHTTPFEVVQFTFEIKAPLFVLRQWHRHRTWTYNEVSGRYRELQEDMYLPDPRLVGEQSATHKQARAVTELSRDELAQRDDEVQWLRIHGEKAFVLYRKLLAAGWPRELARTCLPLNTYSRMFATVDLRNLFGFLTLRTHAHAQYEIRVYAEAILRLISSVVPVAVAAWGETRAEDSR